MNPAPLAVAAVLTLALAAAGCGGDDASSAGAPPAGTYADASDALDWDGATCGIETSDPACTACAASQCCGETKTCLTDKACKAALACESACSVGDSSCLTACAAPSDRFRDLYLCLLNDCQHECH